MPFSRYHYTCELPYIVGADLSLRAGAATRIDVFHHILLIIPHAPFIHIGIIGGDDIAG